MKRLLLLTALILTVSLIPIWVWQPWQAANLDTFSQNIPFLFETRRMLRVGTLPLWSWNTLIGDSFIGSYAYYTCTSPFVWLQCLLPLELLMPSMWVVLYLKFLCTAAITRLYLRKMGVDSSLANTGALLYTFSCFIITNLFYWHFMEPAMLFPLLLYGLERCISPGGRRSVAILALIAFAVAFVNFYFAAGSFLAAFIYMLFRLHGRHTLRLWLRCLAGVALGLALAAPLLLTVLLYFSGGYRAGHMNFPFDLVTLYEGVKRVISIFSPKLIEGFAMDFNSLGFNSSTLYIPFVGILPALLYMWKYRDAMSGYLLLLLVLYVSIPLCGLFTLFRDPLYTRWGYAPVLMMSLLTVRYFQQGGRVSLRAASLYSLAGVLFIGGVTLALKFRPMFIFTFEDKMNPVSWMSMGLAAIGFLLLIVWARRGGSQRGLQGMVAGMAGAVSLCSFFASAHYSSFVSSTFFNLPAECHVTERLVPCMAADTLRPFPSRAANYTGIDNYSQITGTPTISGYSSSGPGHLLPFYYRISEVDAPYPSRRVGRHPVSLMPLLSVDSLVHSTVNGALPSMLQERLKLVRKEGIYDVYSLHTTLPMGFAYDDYLPESLVKEALGEETEMVDMPSLLLSHLVVADSDTARAARILPRAALDCDGIRRLYATDDHYACAVNADSVVRRRAIFTAKDFRGDTRGWECETDLPSPQLLFFSVGADPGFRYYIDGNEVGCLHVNLGMTALAVPEGKHRLTARYMPQGLLPGLWIAGAALIVLLSLFIPVRGRCISKSVLKVNTL